MKKLFYTTLLLLSTYVGFAVPIVVSNQSPTTGAGYMLEYDVEAYLGLLKDGGVCSDTGAFFYNLPAGMTITILDGTTVWTSPWNGTSGCISQYLGSSTCDPFPLDHNGQRMGIYNVTGATLPWGLSPNGMYATTENTIDCHPNNQATTITPTSYERDEPGYYKISYIRFGNALATINYE